MTGGLRDVLEIRELYVAEVVMDRGNLVCDIDWVQDAAPVEVDDCVCST
jgi:hypothetical protein